MLSTVLRLTINATLIKSHIIHTSNLRVDGIESKRKKKEKKLTNALCQRWTAPLL
jgi:hypothetical protein